MKEVRLFKRRNVTDPFNGVEEVYYNLDKNVAEITIEGETKLDFESQERFFEDVKTIVTLAKKEIPKVEDKIRNNKIALHYSQGNQIEIDKAKKHLANNENTLKVIKEWLIKNN